VITEGFVPGITKVGDLFDRGELFLPELIMAAEAMKAGTAICQAEIPEAEVKTAKKVVIGTVEGDIHDIGKSIVVSFLLANGFEVYDLGRDVPPDKFIEKATELKADVIGMSALLTTTMEGQKVIIAELKKSGLRDKVKTIVGGAPTSQGWANRIGADAYGENAVDAVRKIKELTGLS
jgi:dimethylamine corrinoid protein